MRLRDVGVAFQQSAGPLLILPKNGGNLRNAANSETKPDWNKVLEHQWGRALVHESGHALAAILHGIPCYGIFWQKSANKFCALSPAPTEYSRKDFIFLAAGSAAEVVVYGPPYDEGGANADKTEFTRGDAPKYAEAVAEAQELLLQNKRTLKRLVSMLKSTCLRVDLNIANLVERGMDGTEEKFGELMSEAELREAVARK